MLRYKTSRPIVTDEGITSLPSLKELLSSPHPEVRAGAVGLKPFVFGGTKFIPCDYPATDTRLTVLPGLPGVIVRDQAAADVAARRIANGGRSPTPQHIAALVSPAVNPPICLTPRPSRVSQVHTVAFIFAICFAIGSALSMLAARSLERHFAAPACDRRVDGDTCLQPLSLPGSVGLP